MLFQRVYTPQGIDREHHAQLDMLATENAIETGGALFVGAIMLCYFYLYAFHNVDRPEPEEPQAAPPPPPAAATAVTAYTVEATATRPTGRAAIMEAVAQSAERRKGVRLSVLQLATELQAAHAAGRRPESHAALAELLRIFHEQTDAGHEGMLALTEYCNSFVEADALDALDALRRDDEAGAEATELFEKLVPRIWAF